MRYLGWNEPNPCCIVDTTPYAIMPPEGNEALYWSVHYHMHCVKYEVAVSMAPDMYRIVRYSGPYPGSMNDLTIARLPQTGIAALLEEGETVLADGGYTGDPRFLCPYRRNQRQVDPEEAEEWNRAVASARWKVEALNERLKNWSILANVYRHDLELHPLFFSAVARLTNLL